MNSGPRSSTGLTITDSQANRLRIVAGLDLQEADFAAVLELQQGLDLARDPDLPPMPDAELRGVFADDSSDFARREHFVAFEGARAQAIAHLELPSDPANSDLASVELSADYLDQDLTNLDSAGQPARTSLDSLLVRIIDRARSDKRSSLMAWGDHRPAQHQYWTGLGAKLRYTEQESELDLGSVDSKLMDRWIAAAPEGISLVSWTGPCPETSMAAYVATWNAMNDAPIDDLQIADRVVDAADIAAEHEARAACGLEYRVVLATDPNGSAAGSSCVLVNRHRPGYSWQWNTVVLRTQRGRGIARLLKAEMWRQLRNEAPDVTLLRTGNAQSNAAMLAINTAMGFRPRHVLGAWQADLETLHEALLARLN